MAKNTGKVREFCQSGKVGTLSILSSLRVVSYGCRSMSYLICSEEINTKEEQPILSFYKVARCYTSTVRWQELRFKVCLHVPFLSPSPSKFIIVPMVMVRLMDRMGTEPILSIKRSVFIDANGHWDGDGTCKQTLTRHWIFRLCMK